MSYCENAPHLHAAGQVDPKHADEFGSIGYCDACQKTLDKVRILTDAINKQRAASPDGKTAWDRVEEYRIKHGHLPNQDGSKEPMCPVCMEVK